MIARLNGLVLLVLGAASAWFALAGAYTVLMNPAFRWVTVGGALLLLGMGGVALLGRGAGSRSALAVFALFFAVVAAARPHTGGVAPLLAPPGGALPIDREGYERISSRDLFENMGEEATGVAERKVVMGGFAKRLPALDEQGAFVLLQPLMACCLADAIALGLRVKTPGGPLPEDLTWVQVFGDLERVEPPVVVPPFRVGAILFTAVSRRHELVAHDVLSYRALLEDLYERVPPKRCRTFLRLADAAGLTGTLRGEASFTVFVPLDASFAKLPEEERDALLRDPARARKLLEGLIVPGRLTKQDLYATESLETLGGAALPIRIVDGRLRIGGARLLFADQEARNGIVHIVHPVPGH